MVIIKISQTWLAVERDFVKKKEARNEKNSIVLNGIISLSMG